MPKRVKNKPSADPNKRAHQLMTEHMDRLEGSQKPWDTLIDPKAIISEHMRKLGAKGGKVSGAKRMEMPAKMRKAIAKKAATARWRKRAKEPQKPS